MSRVLVTGVSGHVGGHLARELWKRGEEVFALVRAHSRSRVLSDVEWRRLCLVTGDITDQASVTRAVETAKPSRIYHLAGQSHVPSSMAAGDATLYSTGGGALHVLEAALHAAPRDCRVLIVGSSEEYGYVRPEECPITEGQPLRPLSVYGASKALADHLGHVYFKWHGLHVVRTRAFNHCGPGRDERFAEGSWCRQVVEIEAGLREPTLRHGNLLAIRDYTDTRDIARAYVLALEEGEAGKVYNIGSRAAYEVSAVLRRIVAAAVVKPTLHEDPALYRAADVPRLVADPSAFRERTGWRPQIDFMDQTLPDLLDWWRERVREAKR